MRVYLPPSAFIKCVESRDSDEKPRVFVTSDWLTDLHLRTNSVFAMVDAIGVKKALRTGELSTGKLDDLRDRVDAIAARHPQIAFFSFADSLLLKSNWSVGTWDTAATYTYEPERILRLLPDLADAYRSALGLEIYVVITQGGNEFYRDELIHISASANHISLNSLGLPFAQLQAIEFAARASIRAGVHPPAELYMDLQFFRSLKWDHSFDKRNEPAHAYPSPMDAAPSQYVLGDFRRVIDNILS